MCMDSVRVGIARGSGVRGRARPWKAARRRKDVVYLFFRRVLGSTRLVYSDRYCVTLHTRHGTREAKWSQS